MVLQRQQRCQVGKRGGEERRVQGRRMLTVMAKVGRSADLKTRGDAGPHPAPWLQYLLYCSSSGAVDWSIFTLSDSTLSYLAS